MDTFILYMKVNSYDMVSTMWYQQHTQRQLINCFYNNISSIFFPYWKEITLQMYFRQRWSDFRLRYNETSGPVPKTISFKDSNLIWTPDTFFPNSIGTLNSKQNLLRPNEHIRIQPDGNVFYSFRLTVTANCPMDLQYFPFDRQYCEIELESCKCVQIN